MSTLYSAYVLDGNHVKKSVDDFTDLCKTYLEKDVGIFTVDLGGFGPTLSACIAYEHSYKIYIRKGFPLELNRLLRCKELFHALLDAPECRDLDLHAHLEAFLSPDMAKGTRKAAVWEHLAHLAAMEFLFPYSDRVSLLAIDPNPNMQTTADRFGIPVVFVESYLSEVSMTFFKAFRAND